MENEEREPWMGLVARLGLLFVLPLSTLAQSGLTPILPELSAHFASVPHADVLVRFMVTGLGVAMIFGSLIVANIADKIGEKRLLLLSLALFAVFGAAGFFFDDLYTLVASRVLLGMVISAAGALPPLMFAKRVHPAIRDRWLGFYIVSGTLGAVVFMFVIGMLGQENWRYVFLLHLAALPILLIVAATSPADKTHAPAAVNEAASSARFPFTMVALGMGCGVVSTLPTLFMPYYLATIGKGAPDAVAGAIMLSAFLGGSVGMAYGWLRTRLSVVSLFVIGFIAIGAGLLCMIALRTYAAALLGMGISGLGLGLLGPNIYAASAQASQPGDEARVIGYVRAAFYAGPLLGQAPLEPIANTFGPTSALAALALCSAALVALAPAISRALNQTASSSRAM